MPPIENEFTASGFSIKNAYYLANIAAAAYNADLSAVTADLGLPAGTALFTFGEFHGFVADVGGQTVLAFRGTASIDNWLTDGRVAQVQDPAYPGQVHGGFAAAMQVIWPGLSAQLPPGRPVWVTGHSLGAALATLAAVRVLAAGYEVPAV
jgi:triacylglycerol lipase